MRATTGMNVGGKYELTDLLGRGAHGSVFKATGPEGSVIAVKVLDAEFDQEIYAEAEDRFWLEAGVTSGIDHPALARVYEIGLDEALERPFIAMEFLGGTDLAEHIHAHGPMPAERFLPRFIYTLEGLALVHKRGIVHKDIKPANLVIRPDEGAPFAIIDFGVARTVSVGKMTQTGSIMGTAAYMPPEYVVEQSVTPAMDVYQLTLVLAEVLTGTPAVPFGTDPVTSMEMHVGGELEIPGILWAGALGPILRRGLAKDPTKRYQNAAELSAALRSVDPAEVEVAAATRPMSPLQSAEIQFPSPLDSAETTRAPKLEPATLKYESGELASVPADRSSTLTGPFDRAESQQRPILIYVLALAVCAAVFGGAFWFGSRGGGEVRLDGAASSKQDSPTEPVVAAQPDEKETEELTDVRPRAVDDASMDVGAADDDAALDAGSEPRADAGQPQAAPKQRPKPRPKTSGKEAPTRDKRTDAGQAKSPALKILP